MSRKLIVNDGRVERELLLVGKMRVGRDPFCDISDSGALLSRLHAEFEVKGDLVLVRDLGSLNGILLNGAKVDHGTLQAGDVVQVGHLHLRYVEDSGTAPIAVQHAPVGNDALATHDTTAGPSDDALIIDGDETRVVDYAINRPVSAPAPSVVTAPPHVTPRPATAPPPTVTPPPFAAPPPIAQPPVVDGDETRFVDYSAWREGVAPPAEHPSQTVDVHPPQTVDVAPEPAPPVAPPTMSVMAPLATLVIIVSLSTAIPLIMWQNHLMAGSPEWLVAVPCIVVFAATGIVATILGRRGTPASGSSAP